MAVASNNCFGPEIKAKKALKKLLSQQVMIAKKALS
jgi:hypothetical protein